MSSIRDLVDEFTGWPTDDIERELVNRFNSDPDLIARIDRNLMQLPEDKRGADMRALIVDLIINDIVMTCLMREGM